MYYFLAITYGVRPFRLYQGYPIQKKIDVPLLYLALFAFVFYTFTLDLSESYSIPLLQTTDYIIFPENKNLSYVFKNRHYIHQGTQFPFR